MDISWKSCIFLTKGHFYLQSVMKFEGHVQNLNLGIKDSDLCFSKYMKYNPETDFDCYFTLRLHINIYILGYLFSV